MKFWIWIIQSKVTTQGYGVVLFGTPCTPLKSCWLGRCYGRDWMMKMSFSGFFYEISQTVSSLLLFIWSQSHIHFKSYGWKTANRNHANEFYPILIQAFNFWCILLFSPIFRLATQKWNQNYTPYGLQILRGYALKYDLCNKPQSENVRQYIVLVEITKSYNWFYHWFFQCSNFQRQWIS